MDIIFLLERLERFILEESPKFLGNRTVNEEEVKQHLRALREAIPQEISEAKKIIQQHQAILDAAQDEAEQILAEARAEGEKMASDHQFVIDARRQANLIVNNARIEAERLMSDADEYVFDSLSQLQAELNRQIHVVENGLHRLESSRERKLDRR
jgi:cell division septum initiation protein DivIVA